MGPVWIAVIAVTVFILYFALKKFEDLSGKTEEELKEYFKPGNSRLFWRNAIRELKKRGLDTDFVNNDVIELMLSSDLKDRVIGWECFKEVYSREIAYDPKQPSEEVIQELKEMKK